METWLAISIVLVIFCVPLINFALKPERAQWSAAQAVREYRNGETEQAIQRLTEASQDSKDPILDLRLARWLKETGEYVQALERVEFFLTEMVEADRHNNEAYLMRDAAHLRAECLFLLDRKRAALESVLEFAQATKSEESESFNRKNQTAYFRALCGRELKQAESDINSVIFELGGGGFEYPVSFPTQVGMAIGLLSRYTDQREEALELISERLELLEGTQDFREQTQEQLYRLLKKYLPLDMPLYKLVNRAREQANRLENDLVVLRSVKALLLDDLGQDEQSQLERSKVARLGYDASEIIATLPTDFQCVPMLSRGATFLDTRGFVRFANGRYSLGLEDMNLAIGAIRVLRKSFGTPLQNTTDMLNLDQMQREIVRHDAVMHYHRMLILEAMNESERADADRATIKELGFEPDRRLF